MPPMIAPITAPPPTFLAVSPPRPLPFKRVVVADQRIIRTPDHYSRQLQFQLRTAAEVSGFLGVRELSVNISAFARHQKAVHRQVGFQTGVEHVANIIFLGIHAVNHADQQSLSHGNGNGSSGCELRVATQGVGRRMPASPC